VALARLAGKIAPERRRSMPVVRVRSIESKIVVNGRLVTVQHRRPAFAV
jgi:hypothetical protein